MINTLISNLSILQLHVAYIVLLGLFCYLSIQYPWIMKIFFPFISGYILWSIQSNENFQNPFISRYIFWTKGLFVFIPAIMYIYHRELFSFIPMYFYSIILAINIILLPLFMSFNDTRTISTMWNGVLLLLIAFTVPSFISKSDFVTLKSGNMLWILCSTLCLMFTYLYNNSFDIQNNGNGRYAFVFAIVIPLLFSVMKEIWWMPIRVISLTIVLFFDVIYPSLHDNMMKIEKQFPLTSLNEYIEPTFLLVNTLLVGLLLYKNRSHLRIIGS